MIERIKTLRSYLRQNLGNKITADVISACGELTLDVTAENWLEVANFLRRDKDTGFEQLIDLCGVDYLHYGKAEWDVAASSSGFSRAVQASNDGDLFDFDADDAEPEYDGQRFAVVVHLLSVTKNTRVRLRTYCEDNSFPVVPSLVGIWNAANWFEREAFDLFGIMFNNHPDLRRLLTDYGFVGHPFRKDFPLSGQVEMRYDSEQQRVVYEPVSIEPRTLVPRVIRASAPLSQRAGSSEESPDRALSGAEGQNSSDVSSNEASK